MRLLLAWLIHAAYRLTSLRRRSGLRLLLTWLINAGTLVLLPYVLPGIAVENLATALLTALVLAFANTVLRPVLVVLTLPVTVLSLGLFVLVINALLFWGVASFVPGFHVEGFAAAFFGTIAYSLVSTAASSLLARR